MRNSRVFMDRDSSQNSGAGRDFMLDIRAVNSDISVAISRVDVRRSPLRIPARLLARRVLRCRGRR